MKITLTSSPVPCSYLVDNLDFKPCEVASNSIFSPPQTLDLPQPGCFLVMVLILVYVYCFTAEGHGVCYSITQRLVLTVNTITCPQVKHIYIVGARGVGDQSRGIAKGKNR